MSELLVTYFIVFIFFSTITGAIQFIQFICEEIDSYIIVATLTFIALPIMPILFFVFLIRDITKLIKSNQERNNY